MCGTKEQNIRTEEYERRVYIAQNAEDGKKSPLEIVILIQNVKESKGGLKLKLIFEVYLQ